MSAFEAFDRYIVLVTRVHTYVVFLRLFHKGFRVRGARLAGDLAPLRRVSDFAAGRFSAAMLRRSVSIRFTTFSAAGLTGAG
jgi:hypothetical protein